MAVFLDGIAQWPHDLLPRRITGHRGQVFRQRAPGHRHAIAMQQAGVEQHFHQRLYTADRDQLGHQVTTTGSHVGQHGHPLTYPGEIIKPELHARGLCHRQQVQHGVGRAAQGNHHGNSVLKGLAGENV